MSSASFTRGAVVVGSATLLANALVFVSIVVASRWLGPADYGIVGAMLGLVLIITVPSLTFQTHTAREVKSVAGDDGAIRAEILWRRTRHAFAAGAALFLLGAAVSPFLAGLLDTGGPGPIVVTAATAVPLLLVTVFRGDQQGREDFTGLSINLIVETVGRLGAVLIALPLGLGVTGVCAAPAVGSLIALLPFARRALAVRSIATRGVRGRISGFRFTLAYFVAFAALTNLDVIVARARLSAVASGEYAAAAFFGKIVLLVPIAVSVVLVPKVAARHLERRPSRDILGIALGYSILACGVVTIVGFTAPGFVLALTTGSQYAAADALFGPYGLAMTAFAGVTTCGLHALALGRFTTTIICVLAVPVVLAALTLVPASGLAFAWTMATLAGSLFAATLALSLHDEAHPRHLVPPTSAG